MSDELTKEAQEAIDAKTVSLVCIYYDQEGSIPYFLRGVQLNEKDLHEVIIVKDGIFHEQELSQFDGWYEILGLKVPIRYVSLGRKPIFSFRVATAANHGALLATGDYVQFCAADHILAPRCIESSKLYIRPGLAVVSAMHHVDGSKTKLNDVPDNMIIGTPDWKPAFHGQFSRIHRSWLWCHGFTMWPRQQFLDIGGFCTKHDLLGRTEEDHELGARWLIKHGMNALFFGPGYGWMFSDRFDEKSAAERKEKKEPTEASRQELARTLGDLYDHRYYLFADMERQPIYSHVHILPNELRGNRCDARCSCVDLSWMEEGLSPEIIAVVGHKFVTDIPLMASGIARALKPWGRIKLFFPEDPEPGGGVPEWKAALEAVGLEIEEEKQKVLIATKAVEDEGDDSDDA